MNTKYDTNYDEEMECICGHSGDGKCHCCECEHQQHSCEVYEEIDMDEYIDQLDDWDLRLQCLTSN